MPSLISGIGGTVQGPGAGQQQNPGDNLLQIIQAVQQIQGQKQQMAQNTLQTMLKMTEMGLPPEEKEFSRIAKEAGVPIDAISKAIGGNKEGAQAAFKVSDSAVSKGPGGGVTPTTDLTLPKGMGASEGQGAGTQPQVSPVQEFFARAKANINRAELEASHKAALHERVAQLQDTVSNPNIDSKTRSQAMGALMSLGVENGGLQFNVDQLEASKLTPEEATHIYNVAKGVEEGTPAKLAREGAAANAIMAAQGDRLPNGYADALKIAQGQGDKVQLLPDLNRTVKEAELFNQFIQATGDADTAREVAKKVAAGATLDQAVPKGVKSIFEQDLALKKKVGEAQIAGEQARTAIAQKGLDVQMEEQKSRQTAELRQIQLDAQQFAINMEKTKDEAWNKRFDNWIEMKKQGKVDPTFDQNMINEMAVRGGMLPVKAKSIADYLSFGLNALTLGAAGHGAFTGEFGHTEFTPNTFSNTDILDKATKGTQKPTQALPPGMLPPKPSEFDKADAQIKALKAIGEIQVK